MNSVLLTLLEKYLNISAIELELSMLQGKLFFSEIDLN